MNKEVIRFYAENQSYGEFSNFYLREVRIDGKQWPTTEHYFQAQKFDQKAYQEKIRKANSPMKAAELGRSRKVKLKSNWDRQKDNVMYKAVLAKFSQHDDLRALLISTQNAVIIEHTNNDSYWGDAGDGSGKNRLGKILMKVRDQLNNI